MKTVTAVRTERLKPKKHEAVIERQKLLRKVHGCKATEMRRWRICRKIDVLRKKIICEEADQIGQIYEEICSLERADALHNTNGEIWE